MTARVTHTVITGAPPDVTALVDGPAWDAAHTITGLENAHNILDLCTYFDPVSGYTMVVGTNVGSTVRGHNTTVFKAANAYAVANNMMLGHSGGTIEHTGTDSEAGNRVGLQVTCKGFITSRTVRAAIVSYSTNYPALTFGHVDGGASFSVMYIDGGMLQVGFGVDNSAQTLSCGIQFGAIIFSYINNLKASIFADQDGSSGAHNAYIGFYFPAAAGAFFENYVQFLQCDMGALHHFSYYVASSGNRWGAMYIGGSGNFYVDYRVCSGAVFHIGNGAFGTIDELNIEWCDAPIMLLVENSYTFTANQVRFEGCRLNGFNPYFFGFADTVQAASIQTLELYGCVIESSGIVGVPALMFNWGKCQVSIDTFGARWNPYFNGTGDATVPYLFNHAPANVEHRSQVRIGPGYNYQSTAALTDSSISAATLGGVLTTWKEYIYDPAQSRLIEPMITAPSGNGNITVYGCCVRPRITIDTAITTDRKVILSNVQNSSGPGTGLPTASEPMQVFRGNNCTGAFNINVRDSGDTTTVVAMPTANTLKTITRNVTTLTAF